MCAASDRCDLLSLRVDECMDADGHPMCGPCNVNEIAAQLDLNHCLYEDGTAMSSSLVGTQSICSCYSSTATISAVELQNDGSSVALTVEFGSSVTVTDAVFRGTGDITAVSVAEGGSLTVGGSQLVGADVSADPFPCDGTLPDCAREHAGSVVVEWPSAINMAAPLVCDVETGECISDLCFVVDCGVGGTCVTPHGTCACSQGCSGDHCETHTCCSTPLVGESCHCSPGSCGCAGKSACRAPAEGGTMGYDGVQWCDQHQSGWDSTCDRGC